MRSHRVGTSFLAIFLLPAALASCGKPPYHQPEEHFVFIAANINLPYWQEAQAGLTDAGAALGVKTDFTGPASYAPDEELHMFQKAVTEKPSGILLSAAKPDLFTAAINGAIAQGIPVICVDADVPGSRRILFVGTDNVRAGMESGKLMGEILHGQGRIVVIAIPGQLNLDERERGVNEALKKYSGIKVVQTIDDRGDPRIANDQISGLLQAKAKFDGIICLEASGGSGAAEALHRLNAKIPIVAFDNDPETLDWIDRGAITATITQKPYVMSYYGLKFLDDLHHNAVHQFKDWHTALAPPMPTFVDTGTVVVDKRNLKVYREALAAHPKPL
jgi:ribose transport system substrate-binding protein